MSDSMFRCWKSIVLVHVARECTPRSISIKRRAAHNVSIVYVIGVTEIQAQFRNCRHRYHCVDLAKLLSPERGAIGKQVLGAARMIHRRQRSPRQFPIYFLWFSCVRREYYEMKRSPLGALSLSLLLERDINQI